MLRKTHRANDLHRQQVYRAFKSDSFLRLALKYEPDIEYHAHSKVTIGATDKECPHCHVLKLKLSHTGCVARQKSEIIPVIENIT